MTAYSDPPLSTHDLTRGLREIKLTEWLSRFDARRIAVAGAPGPLSALGLDAGPWPVLSYPDLAVQDDKNKAQNADHVFVLDIEDEPAAVARLSGVLGHDRICGLISQVAAARALGLDGPGDRPALGQRPLPRRSYAVLCTARSGSTWFCHLLQNSGLVGHPKEHLRPPVILLARHAARFGFCLGDWIDDLQRMHAKDGIFGTKIIDNFIDDILPALTDADSKAALGQASEMAFIHFERRDKVAQAISKFMAMQTHVWHVRHEDSQNAYREKTASVAYDGPAIKAIHDGLIANEARYRRFLKALNTSFLHLTYEDAMADPDRAVAAAVHFVTGGRQETGPTIHKRYFPMASDVSAGMADRFRADYGLQDDQ